MDKIVALCKRRGYFYPSSEIYGGMANCWDFGHYGTLLKHNLRDRWWKKFVLDRDDMVGIDAAILQNPAVWKASGHVSGFNDALVDCRHCRNRTRADHLIEAQLPGKKVEGLTPQALTKIIRDHHLHCEKCGSTDLTEVRRFNLLFTTQVGIIEGDRSLAYLRGEIAQGIFLNFRNVVDTMRVRLPFGIAQQGKAFRNEITMGRAVHRTLEFDLMEFEYFIRPDQWTVTYEYWQKQMWDFVLGLGIDPTRLRWREHEPYERSHYSRKTMDIEYHYPYGWMEMFGLAYRTDFDLKNHMKHSGKDLRYTDPVSGDKIIPHVIEPTFGLSRLVGITVTDAFREESVKGKPRTYLKLKPGLAPVKAAVFPLQKDEQLRQQAETIYHNLKKNHYTEFDDSGNIGKMYRRQDEIGTPFCVTIDYQTLSDHTVTVRDRDTMKQIRLPADRLAGWLDEKINSY
ncbi:glycine--tRNA ligase [Patescibacteria group bacterium]|nr:glycine--tRNA ligase [Patescibacteria group bacterium]MCL5091713.1 glycine--tRNA ligase [Patescibacteria group bacterium]